MPAKPENAHTAERPMSRQQLVGNASREATRAALLDAAGELFALHGYAGTTVAAIARRASASVPTLYLAWGSKRALLRGFVQTALTGRDAPLNDGNWVGTLIKKVSEDTGGDLSPAALLRGYAHRIRYLAEGDPPRPPAGLAWKLYRDAAAADPEIAQDWTTLQRMRRGTCTGFLAQIPDSALHRDLDRASAIDTMWAITSPELYELFSTHADASADHYEHWMATALIHGLLR